MNILFALYGDFRSNSANPLTLYARELRALGHTCAIAVPSNLEESITLYEDHAFIPVLYADVLAAPDSVFPDGRPADVIHAWTPREIVRCFVTSYMAKRPTPLAIYLEDNERWIALKVLGIQEADLSNHTDAEIAYRLPHDLSHPFRFDSFIGLADAVGVIQDKLKSEVPPWVPCETIMIGVDLDFFSSRSPDSDVAKKYGVRKGERVIVYHGGLNEFTRSPIETLCKAVVSINRQGVPCRLLRAGPFPLEFLKQFPPDAVSMISDLGVLPKADLPDLLALADVFVQPGQVDPFEDLRLPGKIPEFLAMERPVILPNTNIAHLFQDGMNVVLLSKGTAEEIAEKCITLFKDRQKADAIGHAGRRVAEEYFDVRKQARRLEDLYRTAYDRFRVDVASEVWRDADEVVPVPFRLAHKLELIAKRDDSKLTPGEKVLIQVHAHCIKRLHGRLDQLEQRMNSHVELATYERMLAEREAVIQIMRRSASWQITSPLRAAKSLFAKWSGLQ